MWDFAGNAALVSRLGKAAQSGALAHFYIICGPAGSGKRTLARLMAAAMECTDAAAPCLECNQCRKAMKDIHPDVSYVLPEKDKVNIGVKPVRAMRSNAYVRPNEGRRRIFIIPNADTLTEEAQNAMLKMLEEPPGTATFILLTVNADSLLETVRSRAVELALSPLTEREALSFLEKKYPDKSPSELSKVATSCGGLIGKAEELLEKGEVGGEAAEKAASLLKHFKAGDSLEIAVLLAGFEKSKRPEFEAFLSAALQAFTAAAGKNPQNGRSYIAAADCLQTAVGYFRAYVGTGHICGWLSANLTEISENRK